MESPKPYIIDGDELLTESYAEVFDTTTPRSHDEFTVFDIARRLRDIKSVLTDLHRRIQELEKE